MDLGVRELAVPGALGELDAHARAEPLDVELLTREVEPRRVATEVACVVDTAVLTWVTSSAKAPRPAVLGAHDDGAGAEHRAGDRRRAELLLPEHVARHVAEPEQQAPDGRDDDDAALQGDDGISEAEEGGDEQTGIAADVQVAAGLAAEAIEGGDGRVGRDRVAWRSSATGQARAQSAQSSLPTSAVQGGLPVRLSIAVVWSTPSPLGAVTKAVNFETNGELGAAWPSGSSCFQRVAPFHGRWATRTPRCEVKIQP